jgi:hypothetical protein
MAIGSKEFNWSRAIFSPIYQVRSLIGCGHLMNLPHLWKVGGYREELVHQGEEIDLAARAFKEDFKCFHFPGFKFTTPLPTEDAVGIGWIILARVIICFGTIGTCPRRSSLFSRQEQSWLERYWDSGFVASRFSKVNSMRFGPFINFNDSAGRFR